MKGFPLGNPSISTGLRRHSRRRFYSAVKHRCLGMHSTHSVVSARHKGIGEMGSGSVVSQCAFQQFLKISIKTDTADELPHIRSFGELSEIGSMETGADWDICDRGIVAEESEKSVMELTMLALWETKAQQGLFRYDVTSCVTKTLPGMYGFLTQLNEGRATKKRPTELRVDQVVQDVDPQKFNFTKAPMKEVLFAFDTKGKTGMEIDAYATVGRSPDLVMINISPIEYGHVLLVPRVLDRIPQLVDTRSMLMALNFTKAVGNPYFRLGYNSLGAYATINHLHFQGYYLMAPFPVERAPTVPLEDSTAFDSDFVRVSQLVDFPVRGWVFEMVGHFGQSIQPLALTVAHVCTKLQAMNVPHNLLICDYGARVFVWPQCYAEKQAAGVVPEEILATGVNPAAFEIAGHIILKRKQDYETFSQNLVHRLLEEVSLSKEKFEELTNLL